MKDCRRFSFQLIFLLWIASVVFSSCSSTKSFSSTYLESNCFQQLSYDNLDSSDYRFGTINTQLLANLSVNSAKLAHAIGISQELVDYIQLLRRDKITIEQRLELLDLKTDILAQINISSLEISAVIAEMECEEERVEVVANYFNSIERKIENRLTVAAIITGAAGAITAGVLATNERDILAEQVGMITGVAEALYGLTMIVYKRPSIVMEHEKNILRDIWISPEVSFHFPPSIWYYITSTPPNSENGLSKLETLKKRWRNLSDFNGENKGIAESIERQFGKGGIFTADDLYARANMIDQLEAQISLMKQDLVQLAIEIQGLK
jgi:hypothetical protein